jgi:tetratricopeptide (TPR) repeat protein
MNDTKKAAHLNDEGVAYARTGNLDKAIDRFRAALQCDPFYPEAHHNLAFAYYQKGNLIDALAEAETTVRLAPTYVDALCLLSAISYDLHRIGNAIDAAERAIMFDRSNSEAHYLLASALLGNFLHQISGRSPLCIIM